MDGVIAILLLLLGAVALGCSVAYLEKSDRLGVVLSVITAVVCFSKYLTLIQS